MRSYFFLFFIMTSHQLGTKHCYRGAFVKPLILAQVIEKGQGHPNKTSFDLSIITDVQPGSCGSDPFNLLC